MYLFPRGAPRNSYRAYTRHVLTWYEVPCEKSQKYGDFQLILLCLVILPKLAENEPEMCRDKKSFVNYVYLLFLVQIMPNEA